MKLSTTILTLAINVLLITVMPLQNKAQIKPTDKTGQIDELLTSYHNQNRFNGVVLVSGRGEKILSKGYGNANYEFNTPNTPETKFMLASVSKTFTATMIMKLIDQGKLNLDTRLSEVLPWYRKDVGEKVTIRQLLNHTSGIPNYMNMKVHTIPELNKIFGTSVIDKTEFARSYCSSDLEFEPGTKWNYNNSAYFLLAMIVEKLTALPYDKAINEMIFEPLQMTNSGDLQPDPEKVVDNLATGYLKDGDSFRRMQYWNLSTAFGAGSLYSTLDDLLKFDQAFYSPTFLSSKAKEAMFTPGLNGYGCGWELRQSSIGMNTELKEIQTHEGFLFGWHTRIFRIPIDGYFIVILSNTGDSPIERMFTGITDILYDLNPDFPKPSLAMAVGKKYKTSGIDEAIAYGKLLIATQNNEWETPENELNALGYQLIQSGAKEDAVKIFHWNTDLHPHSWNVWDSYGEGLAVAGSRQAAKQAYLKSVELNPDNKSGKEMLKELSSNQ